MSVTRSTVAIFCADSPCPPELVPDEPAAAARQDRRASRATCPDFRLQLAGSHLTQRLVGKILGASSDSRGIRRDTEDRIRDRREMGSGRRLGGGVSRQHGRCDLTWKHGHTSPRVSRSTAVNVSDRKSRLRRACRNEARDYNED